MNEEFKAQFDRLVSERAINRFRNGFMAQFHGKTFLESHGVRILLGFRVQLDDLAKAMGVTRAEFDEIAKQYEIIPDQFRVPGMTTDRPQWSR